MEEFWLNVRDLIIMILKVMLIFLAIDVASVAFQWEFRIPYICDFTDWLFAKVTLLA